MTSAAMTSAETTAPKLPAGFIALAALTAILLGASVYTIFLVAPVELQMGVVQKIFYFHVPSAYSIYVAKRSDTAEAIAVAGAEVGTVFCLIVLITGPLWGRKAWGTYWTWDPRLTTTLLISMVYVAYLLLRNLGSTGEAERRFAAGL